MPGWMILSLIVFFAACVLLVVRRYTRRAASAAGQRGEPLISGWYPVGLFVLAAVLMLVSSYNPVGTKEEGVETSFGKTAGQLSNGPHLTWPWIEVHQMDAAIQTDSFVDTNATDGHCTGIAVRIANQQTGCASVSLQWRIVPSAVDELYKDYRSFEHVREALVTRKLTAAVNEALASYNPLDSITTTGGSVGSQLPRYARRITTIMRREVGSRITILSTILPLVTFDAETQGRINQLQQQVALTRIAHQQFQTNGAQARANAALATKSLSELVLVSRCLDALETMVKASQPVPAGFSCWPGSGVAAVIAGPAK